MFVGILITIKEHSDQGNNTSCLLSFAWVTLCDTSAVLAVCWSRSHLFFHTVRENMCTGSGMMAVIFSMVGLQQYSLIRLPDMISPCQPIRALGQLETVSALPTPTQAGARSNMCVCLPHCNIQHVLVYTMYLYMCCLCGNSDWSYKLWQSSVEWS